MDAVIDNIESRENLIKELYCSNCRRPFYVHIKDVYKFEVAAKYAIIEHKIHCNFCGEKVYLIEKEA